jgi:hypothetical protein
MQMEDAQISKERNVYLTKERIIKDFGKEK